MILCITTKAQTQVALFTDIGNTQTSNGIFLKPFILGQYEFKKHQLSGGIQSSLIGNNPKVFNAIQGGIGRNFKFKTLPLRLQAIYIWNNPAELIRENNWGGYLQLKQKYYNLKLGTHFRTIYYSQQAIEKYNLPYQEKIFENWNLLYAFNYYLKAQDNPWNIGFSVTNMDNFIINQETNPLFYIIGKYRFKETYTVFLEGWYMSAGAFNASVNYFGYFIRTGLKWELKTSKK